MRVKMELRKRALGISLGLVWGLAILFSTWWLLLVGAKGDVFTKISSFYIGYSFSWGGSFIGFLWSFIYGFIAGFLIAWIYNLVNKSISKPKTT